MTYQFHYLSPFAAIRALLCQTLEEKVPNLLKDCFVARSCGQNYTKQGPQLINNLHVEEVVRILSVLLFMGKKAGI